jgi:hypothetical protein
MILGAATSSTVTQTRRGDRRDVREKDHRVESDRLRLPTAFCWDRGNARPRRRRSFMGRCYLDVRSFCCRGVANLLGGRLSGADLVSSKEHLAGRGGVSPAFRQSLSLRRIS